MTTLRSQGVRVVGVGRMQTGPRVGGAGPKARLPPSVDDNGSHLLVPVHAAGLRRHGTDGMKVNPRVRAAAPDRGVDTNASVAWAGEVGRTSLDRAIHR